MTDKKDTIESVMRELAEAGCQVSITTEPGRLDIHVEVALLKDENISSWFSFHTTDPLAALVEARERLVGQKRKE